MTNVSGPREPVLVDETVALAKRARAALQVDMINFGRSFGRNEVTRDAYLAINGLLNALDAFPPDGWFPFGSHAAYPWIGIEFSPDVDGDGMPRWERPMLGTNRG
jgi:hypothetical protein